MVAQETFVWTQDAYGEAPNELEVRPPEPCQGWDSISVLTKREAKKEYKEALALAMEEWERLSKLHGYMGAPHPGGAQEEVRHRVWVETCFWKNP